MKLSTFLLTAFLLMSVSMNAQHVTEEQALQKAQEFMNKKVTTAKGGRHNAPRKLQKLAKAAQNDAYYIFNAEQNGGYVIVSGDERTEAILAYSTEGNIDPEKMPSNMRAWLKGYEAQIKAIPANAKAAPTKVPTHPAVPPMVSTKWGQEAPYNLQCPEIDGQRCVTGCVATALAQIMYYHKWPVGYTTEIPAYEFNSNTVEGLPSTSFNWSIMKDSYYSDETDNSAMAVSDLMRYCGQAIKMKYATDESGAYSHDVPIALVDYFGYDEDAVCVERSDFSINGWDNIIYNEISAGRPVLYSGVDGDFGHAFVCDGYDGESMYHINWGWDGLDGYYLLHQIYCWPWDRIYIFTKENEAIIGIQKPSSEESPLILLTSGITILNNTTLSSSLTNPYYTKAPCVDAGFGVVNADGNVSDIIVASENVTISALQPAIGEGYCNRAQHEFQSNVASYTELSDGLYHIVPVYKPSGATEWSVCGNSASCYVIAEVSNGTLSLKEAPQAQLTASIDVVSSGFSRDGDVALPLTTQFEITFHSEGGEFWDTVWFYDVLPDGTIERSPFPTYLAIPAGEDYIATSKKGYNEPGEHQLYVEYQGRELARASVMVGEKAAVLLNNYSGFSLGNKARFISSVTNTDENQEYNGKFRLILSPDLVSSNISNVGDNESSFEVELHLYKGETKQIEFDLGELHIDDNVFFRYCSTWGNVWYEAGSGNPLSYCGYWDVKGDFNSTEDNSGCQFYCSIIDEDRNDVVIRSINSSNNYDIVIPAKVHNPADGQVYNVKSIHYANCLRKDVIIQEGILSIIGAPAIYNFSSITLPASLESVRGWALGSSNEIQKIYCKAITPPYHYGQILYNSDADGGWQGSADDDYQRIVLYVPTGCADVYRKDDEWGHFRNIVEMDFDAVNETPNVTGKTFRLRCARGYVGYDGSTLCSTTQEAASEFAIVDYGTTNYLYDVTNKAFVIHSAAAMAGTEGNRSLESSTYFAAAVTGLTWGKTGFETYPWYLEDSFTNWMNMDGELKVCMNTWKDFEEGNGGNTYQVEIVSTSFDATEAIQMLDNYFQTAVEVTDEQYQAALNSVETDTQYAIYTLKGRTRYYLTSEGYLTANPTKDCVLTFARTEGDGLFRSPGWKLDACFSNPKLSENGGESGALLPQGHILTDTGNHRDAWEGQVWYLGDNGCYAVRATNAVSDTWGANTYWTVLDNNGDGVPEADYSWAPAFVWQLESDVESVGIRGIDNGPCNESGAWYTLDGRKLNAQPATKGIYIRNNQKVLLK